MSWPAGRAADGGLDAVPLTAPPLASASPGALWLCGKRVVAPDPGGALARASADVIVCFQEVHEVEREHPGYADWLRDHEGERALWFPIPDLAAPPLEVAVPMVEAVVDRLHEGVSLILHCAGGIGRAPTMATLALIHLGASAEAAGTHIASHRPMAGPEVGSQTDLVSAYSLRAQARP